MDMVPLCRVLTPGVGHALPLGQDLRVQVRPPLDLLRLHDRPLLRVMPRHRPGHPHLRRLPRARRRQGGHAHQLRRLHPGTAE